MLAAVILTYRQPPEVLADCVRAVAASGDADEIVVVDNGGAVRAADLDAVAGRPVTVLPQEENLGFAGGMNVGIRHALRAGAAAVAILNDDTVVAPGWLSSLSEWLADGVGAVQPKLVFPGVPVRINSVGVHWRSDGAGIDVGFGEPDRGQYDHARPIEAFTGGAVLMSRSFLEATDGFDEDYFLYYEDLDLSLRGRELGWRYVCEPRAVVVHRRGATTGDVPGDRRYWQERNRLWCLARHAPSTNVARGLLRSAARLARHPTRPQWRAVVDGVRGMRPRRRARRRARTSASGSFVTAER